MPNLPTLSERRIEAANKLLRSANVRAESLIDHSTVRSALNEMIAVLWVLVEIETARQQAADTA